MKLKKLYDSIVEIGKQNDPRGTKTVAAEIARLKDRYKEIPEKNKKIFDQERLTNPYADTRILSGNPNQEIKTILIGIDIEVGEIVLADRLNERGQPIDLVIAHHPEGRALAGFYNVMHMQADILNKFGVPINVAEGILDERIKEVERKVMPSNHNRAVDAAKLLELPFMCAHTPADNCVVSYLQSLMDKRAPVLVKDVVKILAGIPEYKQQTENNNAPKVVSGNGLRRAGKVFVDMTGGTEGSEKMFAVLEKAGVGTVICMHLSEKHIQQAHKHNINVVIAGHIGSDNIGLNILLDQLQKKNKIKLKIVSCSGFYRVER